MDDIDAQLDVIQDRVDQMTQYAGQDTQELHATTLSMIQCLDTVRQAIYDLGKEPEITITDLTDVTQGPASSPGCSVSCTVNGDSNVGGIAGTVSPELGDDPEETLELDDLKLLADVYATTRAVIRSCRFNGDVVVKNDCGGGIAGRCEMGAILDSAARGRWRPAPTTAAASQAGPVAPHPVLQSGGSHRESWLGGGAYLGEDLLDCRAMVRAQGDGGVLGPSPDRRRGDLAGNRYLMEDLAGLDGVDYAERAQGLDFDSFRQLNYLPEDFLTFSYRFTVNGSSGGSPLSLTAGIWTRSRSPLPEQDGQYGQWPFFLDSGSPLPDGAGGGIRGSHLPPRPAGGHSHPAGPGDLLPGRQADPPAPSPWREGTVDGCSPVGAWSYSVTGSKEDTVTLRLRTEGAEAPGGRPLAGRAPGPLWRGAGRQLSGLPGTGSGTGPAATTEGPPCSAAPCGGRACPWLLALLLIRWLAERSGPGPPLPSRRRISPQPVG